VHLQVIIPFPYLQNMLYELIYIFSFASCVLQIKELKKIYIKNGIGLIWILHKGMIRGSTLYA